MKKDWQIKKLGEVCNIIGGTTPSTTNKSYWNGTEKWITPAEIDINKKYIFDSVRHITTQAVKDCSLQLQPKGTVIFTSRAPIGKVAISEMDFYCNQGFKNFVCSEEIFNEYLYYFLLKNVDYLNSIGKGTTFKEISKTVISQVQIPLPPLEEQKRIVAVLDKKFAQVETLKTAAEKNLQNTKQLFQAELEKTLLTSQTDKVVDLFDIKTGKLNSNAAVPNGKYPFFTCSREVFSIDNYAFDCDAILLAGNNASGDFNVKHYCGKFNAYQRTYVLTVKESKIAEIKLLYYVLENYLKKLKIMSVGANTRFLKLGMIQNLDFPNYSLNEQKRIVAHLDSLSEKVHQLEEIYTKQLADCDELKQSLLQKAFEGEF